MDVADTISQVYEAFAGVELQDGIGLWEGVALDDRAADHERTDARNRDERHHWITIPLDHLNWCHSALSFVDGKGMRFLLPAYMIADLKRELEAPDPVFQLTRGFTDDTFGKPTTRKSNETWDQHANSKFALLDRRQRSAIITYLEFRAASETGDYSRSAIMQALKNYWYVT